MIARDALWFDHPVALLDVETTGKDPRFERVCEVAVVIGCAGKVTDRWSRLVNPGRPIAAEATKIHGITDEAVAKAPTFGEIAAELDEVIGDAIPAAYSARFDNMFVGAEYLRALDTVPTWLRSDVEWIDPLVWIWHFDKYRRGKKLVDACLRRGIELKEAHRATADAEASLRVLFAMTKESTSASHRERPQTIPLSYGEFLDAQLLLAAEQDASRRRYWMDNPERRPAP